MGDRGNVVVVDATDDVRRPVWLYTHWSGYSLPEAVQAALKVAPDRWDDPPYLTRVIFDRIKGDDVRGITGYGISPFFGDNEHPIIVIEGDRIGLAKEPEDRDGIPTPDDRYTWTFAEFCALDVSDEKCPGWSGDDALEFRS